MTISTLREEEFVLSCANSQDITDVVQFFLAGLRDRSKYVVATKAYTPAGGERAALEKGDLVHLSSDCTGETLTRTRWCTGTNERTKKEADIPVQ